MPRCVVLVNRAAGRGVAPSVVDAVARRLAVCCSVDVVSAPDAGATAAASERAVEDGVDLVAVLGGDGAAHVAVQALAGTGTALAVLPTGTGNDLARALGMPADPVVAAERAAVRVGLNMLGRIDLGRIDGGGWFGTVLCAGFDARVNQRANRMRWPRGRWRYELAVVRELLGPRPQPLTVWADGESVEWDATLVAVGNTPWYGGGVPVCPAADFDDGVFDVTVVGRVSRWDLVRILPTLRSGAHIDHPAVWTLRAREVRLGGSPGWPSFADGEPQVRLPVSLRCEPGALSVVAG